MCIGAMIASSSMIVATDSDFWKIAMIMILASSSYALSGLRDLYRQW